MLFLPYVSQLASGIVQELSSSGGASNAPEIQNTPFYNLPAANVERFVAFSYPTNARAAVQRLIDSSASSLASNNVTALSITAFPCSAANSAACAPGEPDFVISIHSDWMAYC